MATGVHLVSFRAGLLISLSPVSLRLTNAQSRRPRELQTLPARRGARPVRRRPQTQRFARDASSTSAASQSFDEQRLRGFWRNFATGVIRVVVNFMGRSSGLARNAFA